MKVQRLALAVSLSLLALSALRAATPQMEVADIRPGMVGIGRTVFDGTRVEEFRANIIGVIENVIGTQRNLILARLEGGPLANTGVIAGMSGSPGLHRRQTDRRGVVCPRQLFEGTDRRHHPDRRDDRRHRVERPAPARCAGRCRLPHHLRQLAGFVPQGAELEPAIRRSPGRHPAGGCVERQRVWRRNRHDAPPDRHAAGHVGLRCGRGRRAGLDVPQRRVCADGRAPEQGARAWQNSTAR